MVKVAIVLTLLVAGVTGDLLLGELPDQVIFDVMSILANGVDHPVGNCTNVTETENRFLLYTRNNVDEPILLNESTLHELNPDKPIVWVIHGWISNGVSGYPQQLKNTYLNETDINVVVVDWSPYADVADYTSAYCHVPEVGIQLGDLLCAINGSLKVNLGTVHIVGHSMGAQIAAYAANQVKATCNGLIGRITGLEPAGPGYQGIDISQRLDPTDAAFVDIIHTNQGIAGYFGKVGDVDFYVNCGTLQPGCMRTNHTNITELLLTPLNSIGCDHNRSFDYFIESVTSYGFQSLSCRTCPSFCHHDVFHPSQITMGEHCPSDPPAQSYVLHTHSSPPYAEG